MIYGGSKEVSNVLLGETQVEKLYLGENLIWENYTGILPKGYTECEYLESTGTQYIDLGITLNYKTNIDYLDVSGNEQTITHMIGGSFLKATRFFLLIDYQYVSNAHWLVIQRKDTITDDTAVVKAYKYDGPRFVFCMDNKKWLFYTEDKNKLIYDTYIQDVTDLRDSQCDIYLFAYTFGDGDGPIGSIWKIYKATFSEDGEAKRNMIPCLDTDGVPCMYDTVEQKTYYNSGTGDFLYKIKE